MLENKIHDNSMWSMDIDPLCWWTQILPFILGFLSPLDLGLGLCKVADSSGGTAAPPFISHLVTISWKLHYISVPGRNKTNEESIVMKQNLTISQDHELVRKWRKRGKFLWRRGSMNPSDNAEHGERTCLISHPVYALCPAGPMHYPV